VLDVPTTDPILVGAGDIADCASTGDEATAKLLDAIEGTVFTAGDNAYYSASSANFANCYDPTWGRHRDRTHPVPGNHEYFTPGAAGYKAYFGALARPRGKTWYAYDLGAWRIYALDSECALVGGCGSTSPQGEWLSTDLARHPRRCVAAIWHVPLFSSGIHGDNSRMAWAWRKLDGAGAEIVVAGHDHDFERFLRQHADGTNTSNGMREFVVGTGGRELRSFGTRRPNSMARWNRSYGVLELTLRPAGYAWRFVAVPPATFSDSGSTACS
jgi:calcineurin-like phosphoesterase family protein